MKRILSIIMVTLLSTASGLLITMVTLQSSLRATMLPTSEHGKAIQLLGATIRNLSLP